MVKHFSAHKKYFFLFLLFFPLFLAGCWNYRDLDQLSIVAGVGLDRSEKTGKIIVTAQMINPSALKSSGEKGSSPTPGPQSQTVRVAASSGDTVFQAVRNFVTHSSRRLYWAHMKVLVVGEKAAQEGIYPLLDFFARDHEVRPEIAIIVCHEEAGKIMQVPGGVEPVPALSLSENIQTSAQNGVAPSINLQEFLARLKSKTAAPIATHVEVFEETGIDGKKTKIIHTRGIAIFKGDRYQGEMESKETRGTMFVLGKVRTGIITFQYRGERGSFEILRSKSTITPTLQKGRLHVQVKITCEGNLGDQETVNFSQPAVIGTIEKLISQEIRFEVLSAWRHARDLNTDIFLFGEAVHRKYPREWPEWEARWDEIFPQIQVEVSVKTTLSEIGMVIQPFYQTR